MQVHQRNAGCVLKADGIQERGITPSSEEIRRPRHLLLYIHSAYNKNWPPVDIQEFHSCTLTSKQRRRVLCRSSLPLRQTTEATTGPVRFMPSLQEP